MTFEILIPTCMTSYCGLAEMKSLALHLITCSLFQMISAEHSSNIGKNKLPKNPHDMVIFWIQLRRIY